MLQFAALLVPVFLTALLIHTSSIQAQQRKSALATGVAFSPQGHLWIAGVNEQGQLFVQRKRNKGQDWDAPIVVPTGADPVLADGQNRPKLVFASPTNWLITYTTPLDKPYTGDVKLIRSFDAGQSFTAPVRVHEDKQIITHRFESVTLDKAGDAHVFWIDKRDQELARSAGDAYRGAAIYRSVIRTDQSAKGSSTTGDIKVADHSCECCQIATLTARNGDAVAMWRHVFEPSIRDHAFVRLPAESGRPVAQPIMRATHDDWSVAACPHQGPALTEDPDGVFHAVWFGIKAGVAAVRYGRLNPDGSPLGPAVALPDALAEFADITSTTQHTWAVWRQFDGKRFRLWVRQGSFDGQALSVREIASTVDDNDIPRIVQHNGGAVVVWRTRAHIHVLHLGLPDQ